MDRLLLLEAIHDVLGVGGVAAAGAAGAIATADASRAVQKSMLNAAGKKTASTLTPIPSLRGIAKRDATLAVLGRGAKSAGGSGRVGGLQRLDDAALAVQLAGHGVIAAVVVA